MFISKFKFDVEKAKSYASGFKYGLEMGRKDRLFTRYTPNEIRKFLGLPPIKDGLDIAQFYFDEIEALKISPKNGGKSMDRQKVIDALNAYCDECNLCDNCKIGASPYMLYCRKHEFSDMDDADLEILAKTAEIEILDVIGKRNLVKKYCTDTVYNGGGCAECVLRVGGWKNPFMVESEKSCLFIDGSTEEELDRAIELIQGTVRQNVEPTEEGPEYPAEDPVNRPSHYTRGGIECIDAIVASMEPSEWAGFLKGQVIKYVWRYRLKGKPVEDLKKARYYLDRLIQATEKEEVAV